MSRPLRRMLSVFAGLSLAGALSAAEVSAVRVWDGPEVTRAVFDLSGPVEYTVFTLDNPNRLVLDLQASKLGPAFEPESDKGLVQGLRSGKLEKDGLRLVFDLGAKVKPRTFLLDPAEDKGHRLVVDMQAADKPAEPVRTMASLSMTSALDRKIVVAVDAGHGGEDPGAKGPSGTWEKNITLSVARELAKQINAEPGFEAYLVRDGDYFIPLADRYKKARKAQADLFISIHADAFHKSTVAGASVFMLSQRGASSEAARWLASKENQSDLVGGVSLEDKDNTLAAVLLDLAQSATLKASSDVANSVLSGLKRVGKTHKPQVEQANFVVLRSPDVPSILVETAFISNPTEEKKLNDPNYRRRLAGAIVDGVRDYFQTQPPPGTWLAANISARPREHVVARGETLSQIAVRHGVGLSELRQANGIRGDLVQVGARLRIPGMGPG
ncbi:N-acetylmuramoyl-L-alanine amidase [Pseudomarimonas arenosa]|uniref:N-acetylmuramoyl-L-alanine amidase AmiC n=1 Tax=Pseudomarimonas arenosa TaxID=2774145 RepID=A0AAW3ZNP3_9GAMM|nr:N-acetylmuramoyl-L-alanine amidase [Pseudomarimonas arenosa]MBD8526794.1 N-acetylmuramoyl-L-alanine amidase [Pseudomarimonas arenosa]